MSELPAVLLVDDDAAGLQAHIRGLRACGLEASFQAATHPDRGFEIFQETRPQVAVVDLSIIPAEGVESGYRLITQLRQSDPSCRIIVLTGHGEREYGVRALALGAANFLVKPADISHLAALVIDGIAQSDLRRSHSQIRIMLASEVSHGLVGLSPALQKVIEAVQFAATTNQPILILGETGTGKGLCASVIHRFSKRQSGTFVRYQPHLGSADLVNSDLFGHAKGSFTGALQDRKGLLSEANGGTLFLDEIDELPLESQVSLLGVLHDRRFRPLGSNRESEADFRLISASNQNIESRVAEGRFRHDLLHRINHYSFILPPLRERKEDIPLLAQHVLARLREREELQVFHLGEDALSRLHGYDWPGNIREFEAVVEGGAYRARYHGRDAVGAGDIIIRQGDTVGEPVGLHEQLRAFERRLVEQAMGRHGGNQVKVAQELGIDRGTVRRILARS